MSEENNARKIILIMGPQGSGKSTQAKLVAEKHGMDFISLGAVLRRLADLETKIGLAAQEYWEVGDLVPNDMMYQVVCEYMEKHPMENGFVMDGFPRNLIQFSWMEKAFGRPVDAVVVIELDHEEITKRLNIRRKTENREDENPEAIKARLAHYEHETVPLIAKFKDKGTPVFTVNGNQSIDAVKDDILEELDTHIFHS